MIFVQRATWNQFKREDEHEPEAAETLVTRSYRQLNPIAKEGPTQYRFLLHLQINLNSKISRSSRTGNIIDDFKLVFDFVLQLVDEVVVGAFPLQ